MFCWKILITTHSSYTIPRTERMAISLKLIVCIGLLAQVQAFRYSSLRRNGITNRLSSLERYRQFSPQTSSDGLQTVALSSSSSSSFISPAWPHSLLKHSCEKLSGGKREEGYRGSKERGRGGGREGRERRGRARSSKLTEEGRGTGRIE
jgi:hypothetical protein